uniref:Uncharacterized protein n=1 Tax=Arundo donax TaxID=35708 RepID=A0A0A9DUS6_ARUDO
MKCSTHSCVQLGIIGQKRTLFGLHSIHCLLLPELQHQKKKKSIHARTDLNPTSLDWTEGGAALLRRRRRQWTEDPAEEGSNYGGKKGRHRSAGSPGLAFTASLVARLDARVEEEREAECSHTLLATTLQL